MFLPIIIIIFASYNKHTFTDMKKNTSREKLFAKILEWFSSHPKDSYNYLQVSQELGIFGRSNRSSVYDMLTEMLEMGILNKSFDDFERQLVSDIVGARIPGELRRGDLFEP